MSELEAVDLWAPDALAAPLDTALSLADKKVRGVIGLTSVQRALVVLTDLGGEVLAEDYRELLWQAFGVPIFEQLRGHHGGVIARECEVHDGLHLDEVAQLDPELHPALIKEACECGAVTPRLRNYFIVRMAATALSASESLIA